MFIKIRAEKRGGHVHATFFTAMTGETYANSGTLVFREKEWPLTKTGFRAMSGVARTPSAEAIYEVIIEEHGFEPKERTV